MGEDQERVVSELVDTTLTRPIATILLILENLRGLGAVFKSTVALSLKVESL